MNKYLITLLLPPLVSAAIMSNSGIEIILDDKLNNLTLQNSYVSAQIQETNTVGDSVSKGTVTVRNSLFGLYFTGDYEHITKLNSAINYFVNQAGGMSTFEMTYTNPYVIPDMDYPKVIIKKIDAGTNTEKIMSCTSAVGDEYNYEYSGFFSTGVYQYKYIVCNTEYPDGYEIAWSSFVICIAPEELTNIGLANSADTSSARTLLKWSAVSQAPGGLTYKLYLQAFGESFVLIYEGTNTEYEILNLENGTRYYWKVEAINAYGESTMSDTYSFETIPTPEKAFNYPNPFNPISGPTKIVFDVKQQQTVKITVYSEYGDLVFSEDFNAIPGTNEFLYTGRDGRARMLFDGTYICRVETLEGVRECYLLIIK